jgi:hypothetical protein
LHRAVVLFYNISIFNFVPRYKVLIISKNWRRCWQTHEKLWRVTLWVFLPIKLDNWGDNEMLPNSSNSWSECLL